MVRTPCLDVSDVPALISRGDMLTVNDLSRLRASCTTMRLCGTFAPLYAGHKRYL